MCSTMKVGVKSQRISADYSVSVWAFRLMVHGLKVCFERSIEELDWTTCPAEAKRTLHVLRRSLFHKGTRGDA